MVGIHLREMHWTVAWSSTGPKAHLTGRKGVVENEVP